MNVRMVLAGIGSIVIPAAHTAGFSFRTAVSLTPDAPLFQFHEYTIGNGGQIAAIATDNNFQPMLIYQPADAASPEATIIAKEGLNTYDNGDIYFSDAHTWDRLALTGSPANPQITFTDGTSVYRYQANSMYTLFGEDSEGIYSSINAAGQVLVTVDERFEGNPYIYTTEVSGESVLTVPVVQEFQPQAIGPIQHHSITPGGNVIFINSSSPKTIHSPDTFENAAPAWVGTELINGNPVNPVQLLGATDDRILFTAAGEGGLNLNGVYLRSGNYDQPTYHELFTTSQDIINVEGMLSPNGRAVVTVNASNGDQTLIYWDGQARHELSATDLAGLGLGFIDRPMISDGADMVLFINSGGSLYGWRPGDAPFEIISGLTFNEHGDLVPGKAMIDDVEESVIAVQFPSNVSYYSDLLSDDGHLVVAVTLGDFSDPASISSRLITLVVPEPSMLGLVALPAMALLRRRRCR